MSKVTSSVNAPERSASFLLDEDSGEVKVEYEPDTKVSNSGTFTFNKGKVYCQNDNYHVCFTEGSTNIE